MPRKKQPTEEAAKKTTRTRKAKEAASSPATVKPKIGTPEDMMRRIAAKSGGAQNITFRATPDGPEVPDGGMKKGTKVAAERSTAVGSEGVATPKAETVGSSSVKNWWDELPDQPEKGAESRVWKGFYEKSRKLRRMGASEFNMNEVIKKEGGNFTMEQLEAVKWEAPTDSPMFEKNGRRLVNRTSRGYHPELGEVHQSWTVNVPKDATTAPMYGTPKDVRLWKHTGWASLNQTDSGRTYRGVIRRGSGEFEFSTSTRQVNSNRGNIGGIYTHETGKGAELGKPASEPYTFRATPEEMQKFARSESGTTRIKVLGETGFKGTDAGKTAEEWFGPRTFTHKEASPFSGTIEEAATSTATKGGAEGAAEGAAKKGAAEGVAKKVAEKEAAEAAARSASAPSAQAASGMNAAAKTAAQQTEQRLAKRFGKTKVGIGLGLAAGAVYLGYKMFSGGEEDRTPSTASFPGLGVPDSVANRRPTPSIREEERITTGRDSTNTRRQQGPSVPAGVPQPSPDSPSPTEQVPGPVTQETTRSRSSSRQESSASRASTSSRPSGQDLLNVTASQRATPVKGKAGSIPNLFAVSVRGPVQVRPERPASIHEAVPEEQLRTTKKIDHRRRHLFR